MRSAIRGDFDRLAERRGVQELMQVSDEEPKPESDALRQPEPEPEPEPEPGAEAGDEELAPEECPPEERPRSWLHRFLGR